MEITHVHIVYHPRGSWADTCIAAVFHPHLRQHTWSLQGSAAPYTQLWLRDRGDRLSCACMLRDFEDLWGLSIFGCFCMTNLRPIQSYQFHLYHGCCLHLIWQFYLRWLQRSPLYPDKQLHLPSPVIPLLHTPWTQSQTMGRNGFALLNTNGVQKGIVSGYSQQGVS